MTLVGLTDDSFGSLTVEQMQKFSDHFKVPEQFVKLGDKIVAIPMISKTQQKQESIEQKDLEMNADTSGLAVAGHIGTWHTGRQAAEKAMEKGCEVYRLYSDNTEGL